MPEVETSFLKPRKSLGICAPICCLFTVTVATGVACGLEHEASVSNDEIRMPRLQGATTEAKTLGSFIAKPPYEITAGMPHSMNQLSTDVSVPACITLGKVVQYKTGTMTRDLPLETMQRAFSRIVWEIRIKSPGEELWLTLRLPRMY